MKAKLNSKQGQRIYLDFASATPIDKEVEVVIKNSLKKFANPSSLYTEGREVRRIIDEARLTVSKILNAHSDEIVFTSGATESNNLAILGVIENFYIEFPGLIPHIITSSIEHSAVLEVVDKLVDKKVEVTIVNIDETGIINPRAIRDALKSNTILVSVMYANNEIGTIQPIKEIAKVIRTFKKTRGSAFQTNDHQPSTTNYPLLHTDAAQAPNYLALDTITLGVDLMSLDGGKIYGMKGSGCLYKRRNVKISPQTLGGGQESGLRSGTENILAITSFSKALEIADKLMDGEIKRLTPLRDYFIKKLLEIPDTSINGSIENRLPNNVSVCIKGLDAEFTVYCLDEHGVSCSSASTCMNNKENSYSYVIKSISPNAGCEKSSLRFTLGRQTTKKDVDRCLKTFKIILNQVKSF